MNDLVRGLSIITLAIGIPIALAIGGTTLERRTAAKIWNEGQHSGCGGEWELYSATYVRNQGTHFHYKCKKCKDVFETMFPVSKLH